MILPDSVKQIKNFQYSDNDLIGKGFSSQVFKGRNTVNGQPVALKVIDLRSINTDVEKMLLGNELKALQQLQHQNIVQAHDICQTSTHVYIVTEFCNQGDLTNQIKLKGRFSEEQAMQYFKQIINGLSVTFAHGILHRDLKTANILLKDGVAKIADFGFCDFIHESKGKQPKYNVGSPLYMSPEAYKKSIYSYKSEIWGAGIILYEMLLGQQPFRGIDYDSLIKSIASGAIYSTIEVSGFVKMLLSRMLSIDLQRRIDIGQLVTLLNQNNQGPRIHSFSVQSSQQAHPATLTNHPIPAAFSSSTLMKKSVFGGQQSTENLSRPQSLINLTQTSKSSTPSASKPASITSETNSLSSSLERIPMQQLNYEHLTNRCSSSSTNNSISKQGQLSSFGCGDISLNDGKPSTTGTINGAPNFQKKRTQLELPAFPEPFKKTFISKANLGAQVPYLISFESHLTSYSARHPQFSSASEKLLSAKFLYRLCKLLSEVQTVTNQRCKRLFLLALRHLELSLNHFESENFFFIAQSSEQSSYKKIQTKTKQLRLEFSRDLLAEDEYFTHIANEVSTFNDEAVTRYVQFWVRRTLRDLGEMVQSCTSNLTISFESYEVHHIFACYLYSLKYYEMLEAMRGRAPGEEVPSQLGLAALLLQQPNVSAEGFIGMAQQAKTLVK